MGEEMIGAVFVFAEEKTLVGNLEEQNCASTKVNKAGEYVS
jgi:hypothetical protein